MCEAPEGFHVPSGHMHFGSTHGTTCLAQSNDGDFSTALATTADYADATISSRVLSADSTRRDYGLLLRVQEFDHDFRSSPQDGYRCLVMTGDANSKLRFQELVDGHATTIAESAPFSLHPETWYKIAGEAHGSYVGCSIETMPTVTSPPQILGAAEGYSSLFSSGSFATWNYLDDEGAHFWNKVAVQEIAPPAARRLRGAR